MALAKWTAAVAGRARNQAYISTLSKNIVVCQAVQIHVFLYSGQPVV